MSNIPRNAFEGLGLVVLLVGAIGSAPACSPDAQAGEQRFGADVERQVVNDDAICADCEIALTRSALIGAPDDPASIQEDAMHRACSIGRLSSGEYIVSSLTGGGQLGVYDETGPLIRTIGQAGEGPGEFSVDLRVVVGTGDTLHVIDNAQSRVSSVTASDELVGTFQLDRRLFSFAPLTDGTFVFHGSPREPGDERPLFHIVGRDGTEVAGFGQPSRELADLDQWVVSPRRQGGFWAVSLWNYEIYEWSAAEVVQRTIAREADWFPADQDLSPERFGRMYEELPPPALMWHLWEDEMGLLWTYSLVPALDWSPGPIGPHTAEWTPRHLDTMIEVIDLDDNRLVAQGRYDDVLAPVCGSELMYRILQTDVGDIRAEIVEPGLRRGE